MAFLADQRVDCRAIDISSTGIALWSPVTREPGQFLRVNFALSPPGGIPRWYDADGIVVRVARRPSGVVLGVQFVVIEDRVARDVHGYVLEALRRQPPPRIEMRTGMPDAMNPPPTTGEFYPPEARVPEPAAPARRRTAEYGSPTGPAVGASAPAPRPDAAAGAGPRESAAGRRMTPVPRTTVAAPTARPEPAGADAHVASRKEIERLIQAAVSEVDGQRVAGRKDRRK